MIVGTFSGFYTASDIFAVHLLDLDKVFRIQENPHSWLRKMFQLVHKALGSGQAILPVHFEQEMSSADNIVFLMKVLINHTSNGVTRNHSSTCSSHVTPSYRASDLFNFLGSFLVGTYLLQKQPGITDNNEQAYPNGLVNL